MYGCTRGENKGKCTVERFCRGNVSSLQTNRKHHLEKFHFGSNIQKDGETFIAFYNHVLLEAKHCDFKYTAEDNAVRDQIIIGPKSNDICQEALKKSWDLDTLKREGMKMESAATGGAEINGEDIYKMGAYTF